MARTTVDARTANQRARDADYVVRVLQYECEHPDLEDAYRFTLLAATVIVDGIREFSWRTDERDHPQFEELPFG